MNAPFDIGRLQIPSSSGPVAKPSSRSPRFKQGQKFLKGPILLDWLARAAACPGKALHIAIAVRFMVGLTKSDTVRIPRNVLQAFRVSRYAKSRALAALEAAGLIHVHRRSGAGPVITIREVVESK